MTKADLINKIHANTRLTEDEAFAYLGTELKTIKETFKTAETVKITDVRVLYSRRKAVRGRITRPADYNDHRPKGPNFQAKHSAPPGN